MGKGIVTNREYIISKTCGLVSVTHKKSTHPTDILSSRPPDKILHSRSIQLINNYATFRVLKSTQYYIAEMYF